MAEEEEQKTYIPPPTGRFYVAGWIGAVVLVVALTAGLVLARDLWVGRQSSELERQYEQGRRVLVTRPTVAPRQRQVKVPATIHGFVETQIYAKVSGYLKQIFVDKGDRVKQGQVLAILESPELDNQVANARATYNLRRITDRRYQTLLKTGVVAEQAADESHAAMLEAKATLDQLIATQAYETIKAPFTGLITGRFVDPGALIPQSTTPAVANIPVVSMATLSPLRIYADVPQSVAPFIKDGDQASLSVVEYPDRIFKGSITRHPDALNAQTRTMRVEVDLANQDEALLPGMYAVADFAVSVPRSVPEVPDDALVFSAGKVYVPLVRDNRIHLAEVQLGYDNGQTVEAITGINANDVIAINMGQSAREGQIVQPVFQEAQNEK